MSIPKKSRERLEILKTFSETETKNLNRPTLRNSMIKQMCKLLYAKVFKISNNIRPKSSQHLEIGSTSTLLLSLHHLTRIELNRTCL